MLYGFFFQAEDGIRDYKVTGVQTCALPICLYCRDTGVFNGTYSQVAPTCTSLANASGGGNYIVFNGLTNDAILIENVEPTGDYQAGKIFGFQIVATPATPITSAPLISPNPAYALSPVTLTEVASSQSPMT